ncbi:putative ATP-dependent helicase [Hyphodiscus hymeniophilus]|uniref:ATP-dependent helicase n=1 Tax=Hyphodiscus hymeniophilus TaxID=353542 RepID=A0A9P6VPD3_9HELO|nr:putative ATP-dependent helicase [Hyphodiscus hymeniophilus]
MQKLPNLQDTAQSTSDAQMTDSSFNFALNPVPNSPTDPTLDYILDINKYIPVGCLRIQRSDCAVTAEVWKTCSSWRAFAHPRDVYTRGGSFLANDIQELLLSSRVLQPYRTMHVAGWVRMEFKVKDQHLGQIRIYVLPDDVGRGSIDREQSSLRKAMLLLIAQLDISKTTWSGYWSVNSPISHIDCSLDEKPKENLSLFYLFNTLPSPKPDPEIVVDRYAKDAMYRILDSDIGGLTTKMHSYQRRSAALMLQREAQPSQIIDPRLRPVIDQKGITWYCDIDAGSCLREPRTYESAKGGICAETMGLGKTLICLALILATRELSSQIPVEFSVGTVPVRPKTGSLTDMAAATIGRTGTPWKGHFAAMEAEGYDFSRCLQAIRKGAGHYYLPGPAPRRESRKPIVVPPRKIWLSTATIVVVPPNLVQQWRHEIKKHTVGLKVLVMNSNKAHLPPAQELAEYDIILFSRQRFEKEAKDGSDNQGRRRTTTNDVCRCPYIGSTRERDCTCFKEADAYRSPLKDLHFKRLITDEGHNFGNASSSSRTEAVTVVDFLQLCSRWIVSGTPTQGLYGAEVALSNSEVSSMSNTPLNQHVGERDEGLSGGIATKLFELNSSESVCEPSNTGKQENAIYRQERTDLEKLGNIATMYLRARPWANSKDDNDLASWSQLVMQPRHGSKSHGNMDCLKSTLSQLIIRHRPEDVSLDITLPPLYQSVVILDGSYQDKLSLNMFSMMIVSNAVTSERKDKDFLFHPRQRKPLQELVSNLRQASFFWSGFTREDVRVTIDIAKKFLEKREVPVTAEDEVLLNDAIKVGEVILENGISKEICEGHEMPMYVDNELPESVRAAWALDKDTRNPTLMGAAMVHSLHDFVGKQLWKEDPMDGLLEEGQKVRNAAYVAQNPPPNARPSKKTKKDLIHPKKAEQALPALAGGVSIGHGSSPKKRSRPPVVSIKAATIGNDAMVGEASTSDVVHDRGELDNSKIATKTRSALKKSESTVLSGTLASSSPLASTAVLSTSSAKLSYLMDRIVTYHSTEKIIVFYEADNVAFYIAQALELLGIEHLIYAKSLASTRRSDYVVTFNQSETFRVLLMDVSQAAFGLDMSSASRVYFVNPVFSPQIEAQAVKRAHRIGQTKPVFVETLVLKGSIEEVILERRKDMSTEEHNRCKTILDDQTMYDWIRNVRFLPLPPDEVPGPDQMAKLETPQLVFGTGGTRIGERDPDAGLVLNSLSPKTKGKKRAKKASFADGPATGEKATRKRKLTFAIPEEDDYIHPTSPDDEEERDEGHSLPVWQGKMKKRSSLATDGDISGNMLTHGMVPTFAPSPTQNSFSLSSQILDVFGGKPRQLHNDVSSGPGFLPLTSFDVGLDSSASASTMSSAQSSIGPSLSSAKKGARVNSASGAHLSTRPVSQYSGTDNSVSLQTRQDSSATQPASQTPFSLSPQLSAPSSSDTAQTSLDDEEIEYSTPRPKVKRPRAQVLGIKLPSGDFKLPPRQYTSNFSTSEELSSSPGSSSDSSSSLAVIGTPSASSPDKAQKAKLNGQGMLVRMKIGNAGTQLRAIEEKSKDWRAMMSASGAKIGKRGWERLEDSNSEPPAKKAKASEDESRDKQNEGSDVFGS